MFAGKHAIFEVKYLASFSPIKYPARQTRDKIMWSVDYGLIIVKESVKRLQADMKKHGGGTTKRVAKISQGKGEFRTF